MSLTVVAHPHTLDEPLIFRFFDSLPTLQPPFLPSVWTVDEVQIDVSQPTFLERCFNAAFRRLVAVVRLQLGTVEDVGSIDGASWTREELSDG